MANRRYELWHSDGESCDDFFPADSESYNPSLPVDAWLVVIIEAPSWSEAQQKRYDFMGWGRYRTIEEEETGAT